MNRLGSIITAIVSITIMTILYLYETGHLTWAINLPFRITALGYDITNISIGAVIVILGLTVPYLFRSSISGES
jgi:hypothetical protein